MEALGKYYGDLRVACGRAKLVSSVLIAGWLFFPVALATLFHPTDATGFQFWMQSEAVPRFYTWHQAAAGVVDALAMLFGLSMMMLIATVLFYRRAKFMVRLWPIPGVLIGIVASAGWWIYTGFFDKPGVLVSLSVLALMVFCEAACEHFGADFVFGKGERPKRSGASA